MVGCGSGSNDDTALQALYGVPDTGQFEDKDGDGFSRAEGDCNDEDDQVYPGAPETAGDTVDSNCDGDDDPV
jgi:hypothetical protein